MNKIQVPQKILNDTRYTPRSYNGDLKFIRILKDYNYCLKLKQPVEKPISFLDEINFGESESHVKKVFGNPFFIYRDFLSDLPHTVYTYGLKSGRNKLKVELHFVNKSFFLGTVFYQTKLVNYAQINLHYKNVFGLDSFHFMRDIIVDPFDNFIEFHLEPNFLIMTFSKMKWINTTKIFQNLQ
jgi:hypothetical protein